MQKSLFITYHYPPNGEVATLRAKALCACLREAGFNPEVITVTDDTYELTEPYKLSSIESLSTHRLTVPTHPVFWIYNTYKKLRPTTQDNKEQAPNNANTAPSTLKPGGFFYRLARVLLEAPDDKILWGIKAVFYARKLSKSQPFSFIISTAPPPTASFAAFVTSKLTQTPLVLDYRDPWTITPTPFSGEYWPTWLRKLFTKAEKMILAHAELVIVNTKQYSEYLSRHADIAADKIITIYNGYDIECPTAKQKNVKGNDLITIAHFGTLYINRDPMPFFKAVDNLLTGNPHLKKRLRIQFYGRNYQDLSELSSFSACSKITTIHQHIPRKEALSEMSKADILLAFAEGQPLQIPAKIFEYIGMRKSILLLGSDGATKDLVESIEGGRTAPASDVTAITQTLSDLITGEVFKQPTTLKNQEFSRKQQMKLLRERLVQQFK